MDVGRIWRLVSGSLHLDPQPLVQSWFQIQFRLCAISRVRRWSSSLLRLHVQELGLEPSSRSLIHCWWPSIDTHNGRILSLRIPKPMASFFALLSLVAIKLLYLLVQDIMSTGPSIYLLVTYTTISGEHIATVLCSLASSLSQNVSVVSYYLIFVNAWVSFSNSSTSW